MNRKIVFDAVRRMLGRGFTIPEVRILDQVLESMRPGPDIRILSHGVSLAGIRPIKAYEGCARLRADGRYEAYPDPGTGGAPWTIGWGATGADVRPGIVWTKEQCDRRLEADIARHGNRRRTRSERLPNLAGTMRRARQLSLQHRCHR